MSDKLTDALKAALDSYEGEGDTELVGTDESPSTALVRPLTTAERLEIARRDAEVARQLRGQHMVHGVLGEVFQMIGGTEGMAAWASKSDRNQGQFYRMFASSTPNMMPIAGVSGQVKIEMHPSMFIEGEAVDAEFTEEDCEGHDE